jgi:hypothetical protein
MGVPVGTQTETPLNMATGWPFEVTKSEPRIHWPVTHGPLPTGGTNAQPAMAYGAAMVAMGIPDTNTNGLGTVGTAMPPCAHVTTAPTCRIGPGIASSFFANSRADHPHGPVMTSAVSFMVMVGPVIMMVANPGPQVR